MTMLHAACSTSEQSRHCHRPVARADDGCLIEESRWLCAGTGVVKENGAGASRFQVDQRVVAAPWPSNEGNGTWQQYVVVEEQVRGVTC